MVLVHAQHHLLGTVLVHEQVLIMVHDPNLVVIHLEDLLADVHLLILDAEILVGMVLVQVLAVVVNQKCVANISTLQNLFTNQQQMI